MFENCATLSELSQARSKAVKNGGDKMAINSAYNAAKQRIMGAVTSYNAIPIYKRTVEEPKVVCAYPIAGFSKDPSVLELTPKGFLI